MGSRGIAYSITEGIADIFRNKLVSLLSIITIAVSITVLGLFFLVSVNLGSVAAADSDSFMVHVFLKDNSSEAELKDLTGKFEQDDRVISFLHVAKEEARARFAELFPEEEELSRQLQGFSLPASYDLEVDPALVENEEDIRCLVSDYQNHASVDEVLYDSKWKETLTAISVWVTGFGFFLGGLLIFAAIVTTSNIIKLNYLSRREEIEIMRLVGADNIYIKGPFLVSGILQGLLASLLSIGMLYLVYLSGIALIDSAGLSLLVTFEIQFLPLEMIFALAGGGIVVGYLASSLTLLSVNRI